MHTGIWRRVGWNHFALLLAVAVFVSPRTASADVVHPDDVIIQGSLAVGFDANNGESFGFDTLRLKENNLRVHFDDTSNTSSFPDNDWRIVINDSSNGGGEYFGIEDSSAGRIPFRVEAGARVNSLYVESDGDVGLGTSNPVVQMHIVDGNTPTVRLEQDGSSGFTPQTWDLAGNEANFFIRDVTNGSKLPFRIRLNAPTSSIDIEGSTGDVGFGTGSPTAPIHVRRTGSKASILVEDDNDGTGASIVIQDTDSGGTNKPGFELVSPDVEGPNNNWRFETSGDGDFQIDLVGTGGPELRIQDDVGADQGKVFITTDLDVGGVLSKGSGTFKIDHPLDPENMYLRHSFVESPEMMNIYNGISQLDESGEVWVTMPDWFAALNLQFRYQLTSIGGAAPDLHVAEEIADNRFKIAGGTPGKRVSWQLTGVRQDPFAKQHPVKVEERKPDHERGYYLHPEAYGQPVTKSVSWAVPRVATSD